MPEDKEKVIKTLVNSYLELLNNYFMEICSKITEYLDAIDQEQNNIPERKPEEEKKGFFRSKTHDYSEAIENLKESYKPPVEYFKFIFALERLVQVQMGQISTILKQIQDK